MRQIGNVGGVSRCVDGRQCGNMMKNNYIEHLPQAPPREGMGQVGDGELGAGIVVDRFRLTIVIGQSHSSEEGG